MGTAPFVVYDPLHGYIRVAAHERVIVDHPITQRLRRVTQTGLAELVYPEARTSRFIHSLGAMHLASRFLIAALENAAADVADAFFDELHRTIAVPGTFQFKHDFEDFDPLFADGGLGASRITFRHAAQRIPDVQQRNRRLVAIAEAAVRLAALFHDLGHFPYSHDLEHALKDYVTSADRSSSIIRELAANDAPHEEIGHKLAGLVFRALVNADKDNPVHVRTAFSLAKQILDADPKYGQPGQPAVGVLGWLHSLVDGDVDVDRADYLLRDGRALGLDFAHYDLERLLNNLVLIRHRDMGFMTAIDERGISPVESFFLSRARSSEVLIRHHKVAQIAAALRYASVEVFKGQEGQRLLRTIEAILAADDKATPAAVGERLNEFAPYDDTYWLQALRNVERKGAGELLDATLGLILERQQTLRSVWKRRGDMTRDEIAAFNDAIERAVAAQGDQLSFESIRHRLEEKNILIVRHRFRPFQMRPTGVAGESVFQVRTTSGPEPMSLRSPIVASLSAAWEAEPHLHAFCLRNVDSATAKSIVFEAFQVPQRSAAGGAATVDVTGRD